MKLDNLLVDIGKVCIVEQERMKQKRLNGECFNIFNTLDLYSEEVRLHSAFLAELLSPYGSHGLEDAFLKEFLSVIGIKQDYLATCNGKIVERYIGERTETTGGRIDIILEDGEHAVIIENKINAADQHHQMLRYHNYGKMQFPKGFELIYLTLDGHEASNDSLGDRNIDYHCVSYEEHIIQWLSQCVRLAYDKPLVRETISQYITLVKQITGQDMDKDSSDKIVDLAINNMEAVVALMDNRTEISRRLRNDFVFEPLREFASENGLEFEVRGGSDGPAILFRKSNWSHCIAVTRDGGRDYDWKGLYIGVSQYYCCLLGNEKLPVIQRLSCFSGPDSSSNEWWPYGSEWLPCNDWHSTSSYLPMKTGRVANWIISKVTEIIKELETKGLPM